MGRKLEPAHTKSLVQKESFLYTFLAWQQDALSSSCASEDNRKLLAPQVLSVSVGYVSWP